MTQEERDALKQFYRVLEDRALEPDEAFFEPRLHSPAASGHIGDPIEELVDQLEYGTGSTMALVSGQRGAGKSTELRRLRKRLEQEGHLVFLLDMKGYIHLNRPLEITDFLIVLMGAFGEAVDEAFKLNPLKESYWERCRSFMQKEIVLGDIVLKQGIDLKLGLNGDPTFKTQIQRALKGQLGPMLQNVNQFVSETITHIREYKTCKKVVLLVDSLEQIRGLGEDSDNVHQSIEVLFRDHLKHLALKELDIVYTVPPYLFTLVPMAGLQSQAYTWVLASSHVVQRSGETDPQGLVLMGDVISKRFPTWKTILSEGQLKTCILSTGGDLRGLFRMLQLIALSAGRLPQLPVTDALIEEIKNKIRRDMLPLASEDVKWLKKIRMTKDACLVEKGELHRLAGFFDGNLVQTYRNGEDWYDVHPLIHDIIDQAPSEVRQPSETDQANHEPAQ